MTLPVTSVTSLTLLTCPTDDITLNVLVSGDDIPTTEVNITADLYPEGLVERVRRLITDHRGVHPYWEVFWYLLRAI